VQGGRHGGGAGLREIGEVLQESVVVKTIRLRRRLRRKAESSTGGAVYGRKVVPHTSIESVSSGCHVGGTSGIRIFKEKSTTSRGWANMENSEREVGRRE
jgi:hypothetical protein